MSCKQACKKAVTVRFRNFSFFSFFLGGERKMWCHFHKHLSLQSVWPMHSGLKWNESLINPTHQPPHPFHPPPLLTCFVAITNSLAHSAPERMRQLNKGSSKKVFYKWKLLENWDLWHFVEEPKLWLPWCQKNWLFSQFYNSNMIRKTFNPML